MKNEGILERLPCAAGPAKPLVVRLEGDLFQREVLEKLARLEAKMDMMVGGAQPGRMKLVEDRVMALERNDIRRSVYDRMLSAGIAFAVSGLIALRGHWGWKW
jgi:hypothetical protein